MSLEELLDGRTLNSQEVYELIIELSKYGLHDKATDAKTDCECEDPEDCECVEIEPVKEAHETLDSQYVQQGLRMGDFEKDDIRATEYLYSRLEQSFPEGDIDYNDLLQLIKDPRYPGHSDDWKSDKEFIEFITAGELELNDDSFDSDLEDDLEASNDLNAIQRTDEDEPNWPAKGFTEIWYDNEGVEFFLDKFNDSLDVTYSYEGDDEKESFQAIDNNRLEELRQLLLDKGFTEGEDWGTGEAKSKTNENLAKGISTTDETLQLNCRMVIEGSNAILTYDDQDYSLPIVENKITVPARMLGHPYTVTYNIIK